MDAREQYLATCADDIRIWEFPEHLTPLRSVPSPHYGPVLTIRWNHNGQVVASGGSSGQIVLSHYTGPRLGELDSQQLPEAERDTRVNALCFSSGSRYLVSGGDSGVVKLWDLKKKHVVKRFFSHESEVVSLTFNPSDTHVASCDSGAPGRLTPSVCVDNVLTGKSVGRLQPGGDQAMRSLQFSPHRHSFLAGACDDGAVYLYDFEGPKRTPFARFAAHSAPASAVVFSSINQFLLASVGLDKRVNFFDVRERRQVRAVVAGQPLTAVAFKNDGYTFATGTAQGDILVYDLRAEGTPLSAVDAHRSAVADMQFQKQARKPLVSQSPPQAAAATPVRSAIQAFGAQEPATSYKRPPTAAALTQQVFPSPTVTGAAPSVDRSPLAGRGEPTTLSPATRARYPSIDLLRSQTSGTMRGGHEPARRHPLAPVVGVRTQRDPPEAPLLSDAASQRDSPQSGARAVEDTLPSPPKSVAPAPAAKEAWAEPKRIEQLDGRVADRLEGASDVVAEADVEQEQVAEHSKNEDKKDKKDKKAKEEKKKAKRKRKEQERREQELAAQLAASVSAAPSGAAAGLGAELQVKLIESVVSDVVEARLRPVLEALQNVHVELLRQSHLQQTRHEGFAANLGETLRDLAGCVNDATDAARGRGAGEHPDAAMFKLK